MISPEERVWWEELADQYEKWAENPPRADGLETYTCYALEDSREFTKGHWEQPHRNLREVWQDQYGYISLPIGETPDPWNDVTPKARAEKRFEFCHYMAETIRENLEQTGG